MSGNSTRDLVEINEEDISYFKEMLSSRLTGLGVGAAVLAMLPAALIGGPALALFPLVAVAGGAAIAGLFVPASPVFRHRVNRRLRSEKREELRYKFLTHLAIDKARRRAEMKSSGLLTSVHADLAAVEWNFLVESYRDDYRRMVERLSSLLDLAEGSDTALSTDEVEKLQDSTVDYLRLVYARKNVLERLDTSKQEEVELRISDLDEQIQTASPALKARLIKAKEGLIRTKHHVSQLPGRDAALAAQLLHMTETFEELYHRITADPGGSNLSGYLDEATQKMSIEEELQWAADSEVAEMRRKSAASKQRT